MFNIHLIMYELCNYVWICMNINIKLIREYRVYEYSSCIRVHHNISTQLPPIPDQNRLIHTLCLAPRLIQSLTNANRNLCFINFRLALLLYGTIDTNQASGQLFMVHGIHHRARNESHFCAEGQNLIYTHTQCGKR